VGLGPKLKCLPWVQAFTLTLAITLSIGSHQASTVFSVPPPYCNLVRPSVT